MEVRVIKDHTEECASREPVEFWGGTHDFNRICELNRERIIMYIGGRFFYITYPPCICGYGHHLDFKKAIIEKLMGLYIDAPCHYTYRDEINNELRSFRRHGVAMRKFYHQHNFIYTNATGKLFAIQTEIEFMDALADQELLKERYLEAKVFLEEENPNLIFELDELYKYNKIEISDYEIHKSVDSLITSINKIIKQ